MPIRTQKPLSFDFNAAAEEAYRVYPQLAKNSYFYDVAQDHFIAKSGLLKKLSRISDLGFRKPRPGALTSYINPALLGHRIQGFFYIPSDDLPLKIGGGSFAFDHELMHMLKPNPRIPKEWYLDDKKYTRDIPHIILKGEMAADAYAVIRHFQRHGIEGDEIPALEKFRYDQALQSNVFDHMTSPVIAALWGDRHKVDFISLSPEQTLQKAWEYAEKYTPDPDALLAMKQAQVRKFTPKCN
jgi:hypothetical protein